MGSRSAHICGVVFIFHFAFRYLAQSMLCFDLAQVDLGCRRLLCSVLMGFSPSQGHERGSLVASAAASRLSARSLGIQDHMKQPAVMN